jgi:hypothetical protein
VWTVNTRFILQFPVGEVDELAGRYSYEEDEVVIGIGSAARERGYYTRDEFREVCRWKSPRSKSRVARNNADTIESVTAVALSTHVEELRIWAPQVLDGVSWATASVLLHLAHKDRYPILDFRALEALGVTGSVLPTMEFWHGYVAQCRRLADQTGLPMRTLDRALWQWSKEQGKGGG